MASVQSILKYVYDTSAYVSEVFPFKYIIINICTIHFSRNGGNHEITKLKIKIITVLSYI